MYFEDAVTYFHKIIMFSHKDKQIDIQGVPKNCQNPGNSALLVRRLILFLSECLTRRKINAARIVLLKSTIKLNNFSSDKKHNL